jgi:ATP-dependent Lon protease
MGERPQEAPSDGREALDRGADAPAFVKGADGKGRRAAGEDGKERGQLVLSADEVIVVPVRNMVLFPSVVLPMMIGRERSVRAVQEAVRSETPVGVVLQRDETVDEPGRADLYDIGTLAEVVRYLSAPDGRHHAVCQGEQRFRLKSLEVRSEILVGKIERIESVDPENDAVQARFLALKQQAAEVLQLSPGAPEELSGALAAIDSPGMLADMVAAFMDIPPAEKQEVLETLDVKARLDRIAVKLGHLADVLELSNKIRQETRGTMSQAQREYYLREQLRTIQKELGAEGGAELADLREAIEKAGMPEEARKQADTELVRLARMPESSAEHSMVRTYLDVLVELPWSKSTEDAIDLDEARRILDRDHHGLEKVKRLILEYLAVYKLKPDGKRPNLCLVGPPGVGKTSLGQSIARALKKKFVRVSLGGVHDEAEIRGHRRTYIGALPGNIVQGMRKAGSNNPVFMLDEMDKLASSMHGDPSSALLEVLDPEQNRAFRDNYLGVPFDLSRVLFIGTANVMHLIPGPLRDRFEVIELAGYTELEKLEIARRHLVARQLDAAGLDAKRCTIEKKALERVIESYTREAGVRGLERNIGRIARWAATRIASGEAKKVTVKEGDLDAILGAPRFESELAERTSVPGVATGLAWTPYGGQILFIEVTGMPGIGNTILTGQLGDVMRESAMAAMSLLKARSASLAIKPEFFREQDVHLHMPAGAIPKDGPSAGVAMFVALVSLYTAKVVKSDVAMTGEISLRGRVLPVGGIKEKVLGAAAAGIKTVLLPRRNLRDLDDVPEEVRKTLTFVPLETVDDALRVAFEEPVEKPRRKPARRKAGKKTTSKARAKKAPAKKARKKASRKKASPEKASPEKAARKKASRPARRRER